MTWKPHEFRTTDEVGARCQSGLKRKRPTPGRCGPLMAEAEGEAAAKAGLDEWANPYCAVTQRRERREWLQGYWSERIRQQQAERARRRAEQ